MAVASFINGTCWAADNPVRRMMIGDVVGPDRISTAMSFDIGTNNASRVIGPMVSGVLLAQYGIASVFWLGVALYAASLVAALRLRIRRGPVTAHPASFIARIREGFAWLRGDRRLIGVFLVTVIFNVFGWPFTSMIPVIGTDYLHLGPQGVGLLASCDGLGGLVGALLVASLVRPEWYGRIYVGAVAFYLAAVIGFALAPVAAMAGVLLLLAGTGAVGFAVLQTTLVYRSAPVKMRARLLGVLSVCIGTGPIGFLYLGFLADILSPRIATVALGAQGLLVLLLTRRYWKTVLGE
jgi:MFS family permease